MKTLLAKLSGLKVDGPARILLAGISAGLIGRMVALGAPLVATPVLYRYFGDAGFGVWITAISITSIAVSLDLGIGSSLLTRTANAYNAKDTDGARRYIASAYGVLAAVALGLGCLSTLAFIVFRGMADPTQVANVDLFFAVVMTFLIGLPAALIHQVLYAVQKIAFSSALLVCGAFGGLAAAVAGVHLGAPPWLVAVAYSAPSTLAGVIGAAIYFRRNPALRPAPSDFDKSSARDLLNLGSRFLILSILMAVGLNVDNAIIASKAGAEAVAAYAIPARLGSILGLIIINLFMPLWGANSDAMARGDYEWVRRGARRMSLLGVAIVSLAGIALIVAADQIMNLWVGRSFQDQTLTLGFVIAGAAIVAATSPYNMLLNALARPDLQILPWACFVVISVPAKFLLVTPERLWIAAAATALVYMLTITPAIMMRARRELAREATLNRETTKVSV